MTIAAIRNLNYINLKDYCQINGSNDDSAGFTTAYQRASALGMGIFHPGGTLIKGNDTLLPNVPILGMGPGVSIIKLKNGANTDLFSAQTSSINLSAAINSGITGTLLNFSIQGMTIDGNKANQSSGTSYPLRFYGYNFVLRDLEILNGYTGGALIDWNGPASLPSPSDDMESYIDTVKFHDNNGIGFQIGGPHDSRMHNVISFFNGSHNFHIAPNATGILSTNCHGYLNPNVAHTCCYLVEAEGCKFTNCVGEGSYSVNVAMIAADIAWIGGDIYGPDATFNSVGIQLGQQAGQAPFAGQIKQAAGVTTAVVATQCMVNTTISECVAGALNCVNEGNNTIIANINQSTGSALVGNTINLASDNFSLQINGLTADGTRGKSSCTNISSNGGSYPFTINDASNGQVFQVDNFGNMFFNGGLNTGAGIYFTASTSPNSLATNGTISAQGIPNIVVAPTGNVTGVILQPGYGGQICCVLNASAFTVTFAASGTSNVADGVSAVIAANKMMVFFFDGTNSLWYHA